MVIMVSEEVVEVEMLEWVSRKEQLMIDVGEDRLVTD